MDPRMETPYWPPKHLHSDKEITLTYSHKNNDGLHVWICSACRRGVLTDYIPTSLVKEETKALVPTVVSNGGKALAKLDSPKQTPSSSGAGALVLGLLGILFIGALLSSFDD